MTTPNNLAAILKAYLIDQGCCIHRQFVVPHGNSVTFYLKDPAITTTTIAICGYAVMITYRIPGSKLDTAHLDMTDPDFFPDLDKQLHNHNLICNPVPSRAPAAVLFVADWSSIT